VKASPLKTSVEVIDPVKVTLTVSAEPDRVRVHFDRAAKRLAKQVDVPGFRKGKAPRRIIEQRIGVEAIAQTALEDALQEFYVEALRDEQLDTVARPELEVDVFTETEGCAFTATVEVRPKFELADHTGIHVSFPEWQVPAADLDAQLDRIREQFAEVEVVERPAATGDLITLDLRLSIDGVELEAARVEGALYEVGSGGVTPALDEQAVGASAGSVLAYEDALPAEYHGYGGRTASFEVTVLDVRSKRLPELDDDFADTAGGFDSMDELRQDITDSLLRQRILRGRHELRGVVTDAFVALHEVPVPPTMLAETVAERIARLTSDAERFGGTLEELLELEGTDREQYEVRLSEQAGEMLKAQLVLDALSQQLGLTVLAADIDRELVRLGNEHGVAPAEVARLVQEQGTLSALVGDVLRRKTIDAILDAAAVTGGPSEADLQRLGLAEPDPDPEPETESETEPEPEPEPDTDA
jgi:trigger factor